MPMEKIKEELKERLIKGVALSNEELSQVAGGSSIDFFTLIINSIQKKNAQLAQINFKTIGMCLSNSERETVKGVFKSVFGYEIDD